MNAKRHTRMNAAILSVTDLLGRIFVTFLLIDLVFPNSEMLSFSLMELTGILGIVALGYAIIAIATRTPTASRRSEPTEHGAHHAHSHQP